MMSALALALASALSTGIPEMPAPAPVVHITEDEGGFVADYESRYDALADGRATIEINGPCVSACTLVFSHFPRDRVCVTANATFGLHEAWTGDEDNPTPDMMETARIVAGYPDIVKAWIKAHKGLILKVKYMPASALHGWFKTCPV